MIDHEELEARMRARLEQAGLSRCIEPARLRERSSGPLTATQRRMLSEWLINPGSSAYHVTITFIFPGEISLPALRAALSGVVRRQEILRTRYEADAEGQARQFIEAPYDPVSRVEQLGEDITRDEIARRLAHAIRGEITAPFDLGEARMLRAHVIHAPGITGLAVCLHHIAWDSASFQAFTLALREEYERALSPGGPAPGAGPEIQMLDLAHWERQRLARQEATELKAFWGSTLEEPAGPFLAPRQQLAGDDPAGFAGRPEHPGSSAGSLSRALGHEAAAALRRICSQAGTTPFAVLTGIIALSLKRHFSASDIIFGTTPSLRDEAGAAGLMGCLIGTMPLRVRLRPEASFASLAQDIQVRFAEALAHTAYPFERIMADARERSPAFADGLFQVMLQHISHDLEGPELGGVPCEWQLHPAADPHTPLFFEVFTRDDRIDLQLTFSREHLDEASARQLLGDAAELIGRITPRTRLCMAHETAQAQGTPAAPRTPEPPGAPAARDADAPHPDADVLLRRWARDDPSGTAIITSRERLSRAEHDRRVNALARILLRAGVRSSDAVGILLPRSIGLSLAMSAALRIGACYVPLDATLPEGRIAALLSASAPCVLITTSAQARGSRAHAGARKLILLDDPEIERALREGSAQPPPPSRPVQPRDDALIVFTSGSTGTPKGVRHSREALAARIGWGMRAFFTGQPAVVLARSSIGFIDAAVEHFGTLAAGGTLCLPEDMDARSPREVASAAGRFRATHMYLLPAFAEEMLRTAASDGAQLSTMRHYFLTGEPLRERVTRAALTVSPGAAVHDLYGSTEVFDAMARSCAAENGHPRDAPPFGKAVPGMTVRVLDDWLRQVPPGAAGELYVGGPQLAAGYLGSTRLSAERFIADPLGSHGARLYRTGDLARLTRDGGIALLGRSDAQLKVRGFRVEPAEIAGALETHPEITVALVLPYEHPRAGTRLMAYYTSEHGSPVPREGLHQHLLDRLPEYMLPDLLRHLEAIPLTPTGKADLSQLPAIEHAAWETGAALGTERERAIAQLVRETLGFPDDRPLSADDDFFRLSGDSILAGRLVSLALRRGLRVQLRDVFEQRTIAGIAQRAAAEGQHAQEPAEPVRLASFPVLDAMRESGDEPGAWLLSEVLHVPGHLPAEAASGAFGTILRECAALRMTVRAVNRRLWTAELNAAPEPSGQFRFLPGAKLAALREQAAALVDITRGRPAALTMTAGDAGAMLVLAAHPACLDRASLHRLALRLTAATGPQGSSAPPAGGDLAALLHRVDARGAALSGAALCVPWQDLLSAAGQGGELLEPGAHQVLTVPARAEDARLRRALLSGLARCDADRRSLAVADIETTLLQPDEARGDPLGPFTAITPVSLHGDASAWDGGTDAFPLLRHQNREARRILRRSPRPSLLITRLHGPCASRNPEGIERCYRAVIRYRIEAAAIEVEMIGLGQGAVRTLREELSTAL